MLKLKLGIAAGWSALGVTVCSAAQLFLHTTLDMWYTTYLLHCVANVTIVET